MFCFSTCNHNNPEHINLVMQATGAFFVMHTRLFKIVKNNAAIITYFGVIGNNATIDFATLAKIGYNLC